MRPTTTKAIAGLGALALLAGTGSALASSGASTKPAKAHTGQAQRTVSPAEQTKPDTDNVQSGGQSTPDTIQASSTSEPSAADTDTVQSGDQTTPDTTTSAPEQGQENGSDQGSEIVNSDGPGGHADEPGNPNADHQFQGTE